MAACWGDEAAAEEQRVSDAYDKTVAWLRGRMQEDVAKSLNEAQVQWSLYRDLHCEVVADIYAGGSIAGLQRVRCRAALASARRQELETAMADASN